MYLLLMVEHGRVKKKSKYSTIKAKKELENELKRMQRGFFKCVYILDTDVTDFFFLFHLSSLESLLFSFH